MRDLRIVEVFSAIPVRGNPVAVVLQADGIGEADMQAIAAWTKLSEAAFHLTPVILGADYRLRIFTPRSELPFAGHPTLGSAHALIEAGLVAPRKGRLVQECVAGQVPILAEEGGGGRRLHLERPEATVRDLSPAETARLAAFLGAPLRGDAPPALVDVGARWIVAELADAPTVTALASDPAATGITVFGRHAGGAPEIKIRSFTPYSGVPGDPVCGSGNGSAADCLLRTGALADGADHITMLGRSVGRDGSVRIGISKGKVFIGGASVTTVVGTLAV